jgi:ankyrin repeat protein
MFTIKRKIRFYGNLFQSCDDKEWPEVRKYLSSDAAEEKKKSNIMFHSDNGKTSLHLACYRGAPDDITKAMIDIGGKEVVMDINFVGDTALHYACIYGASYNIIRILIEVGDKNLVMAKSRNGNTALHYLCWYIMRHTKVAEKIKLFLQVGDANLLLSTKDNDGKTPLEIVTIKGASNKIKKLLTLQSTTNSTISNNSPSTNIIPGTPITQSSQEQDTTRSSYNTNNDPTIPIRGLGIDQNHQSQLREAKEKAKTMQQDFDKKCTDYSDLEENSQSQLKIAKEQISQIQRDYDQKCADCCHLKEENQVECTEKLQLGGALAVLKKDLYQCKRMKVDLEHKVEAQEGEAACAQELLEESNRRTADVEATVETQRLEIADLTNEKDGIEKECMDNVDKLTRKLSKQQAELQLLKKSSSEVEVGMKRKHTNEEHEEGEGTVIQSQTQSSKRRKVGNMRNASSGSLNTNQAEDDDDDAVMIAGQLDQYTMLMSRYMATRRKLRRATAENVELKQEIDDLAI